MLTPLLDFNENKNKAFFYTLDGTYYNSVTLKLITLFEVNMVCKSYFEFRKQ